MKYVVIEAIDSWHYDGVHFPATYIIRRDLTSIEKVCEIIRKNAEKDGYTLSDESDFDKINPEYASKVYFTKGNREGHYYVIPVSDSSES